MPGSTETAVFDSSEFIAGRTALGLDELGIHVREANWGDSDMELFMIKKEIGEIPAERHPPNRTVTLKLLVTREAGLTFAEAINRLQAKVNTLQKRGGWVKRVMDTRGQFKHPVGGIVYKATLSGIDGWFMGHRATAPEITLTLSTSPYFYSTEEIEGSTVTITLGHQIEWELAQPQGTAPGLIRIELENQNVEAGAAGDWHGAIAAIEAQYHSSAASAKMTYKAEELTRLGASELGTRAESANTHTVKSRLGPTYQPVLGSKITGSGQMTHTGPRNILMRIWDPNSGAGQVKLKLQWKALGSDHWSENEELATTLVNGFSIINLGECRPEIATLGNQVWEWRLLGKAAEANQEIELDVVWVLPTEQYLSLVFEPENESYAPVVFEDLIHNEEEGTIVGKKPAVGGTYEIAGDAVGPTYLRSIHSAHPFFGGVCNTKREETGDTSAATGSFAVGSAVLSGNENFIGYMYGIGGGTTNSLTEIRDNCSFGFVLRYTNTSNWLALVVSSATLGYVFRIIKCVAGTSKVLKETPTIGQFPAEIPMPITTSGYTVSATLNTEGELTATFNLWIGSSLTKTFILAVKDSVLSSTGALKEGKTGIYDYQSGSSTYDKQPRFYGNLLATKPEVEERGAVCYAGKKLELRTDGIFREGVAEAAWARLTPLGFLPFVEAGGLENSPMRGIVIPTRGDFEARADSGVTPAALKVRYRPGYLFTSGG